MNKKLERQEPQTESQRAMAAHDEWERSRGGNVPKKTLDQVAKQFRVSKSSVKQAGEVKASASKSLQQSVRDGTNRIGTVANAAKKAAKVGREIDDATFSVERNRQTLRKKIGKIQSILTSHEQLPDWFSECDDLIGRLEISHASSGDERKLLGFLKEQYNRVAEQNRQKMC